MQRSIMQRPCGVFTLALLASMLLCAGVNAEDKQPATQFYLVGMGPGDPDLITVRALRVIEEADVIVCAKGIAKKFAESLEGKPQYNDYWRLFPFYGADISKLEGAERTQAESYEAKRAALAKIVREAVADGKTVAVLDNGDPLVYGPCAWMLEEFEDLKPVVVPGVSCFNAANAALRRGITTSENTKSVILTAADWLGKTDTIDQMAKHQSTMALFTMRTEFREFIEKLSQGYPPETPIAIVKHAGYSDQEEVVETTLGRALDDIDAEKLPFEYMIYVGDFLTYRYKDDAGK